MFSTRETRRRTKRGLGEETSLLLLLLVVALMALAAWSALSLGSRWAGLPVTRHPVGALLEVATRQHPWPWQATLIAVVYLLAGSGLAVFGWRTFGSGSEIDAAARTMQRPRDIRMARRRDILRANKRLLRDAPPEIQALKGPPLGKTVIGGVELFVPAELGVTIAAGTRTGKTMAWAIPAVLSAWGPCLATSNKPDLYRHTVYGREQRGQIWLCDLQAVTGKVECGFWVDLLAQVTSLPKARKLAGFFVSAASGSAAQAANAKVDSYFDGGAQELLSLYLYAAACAGGDLLHVAEWLGRDQDQTPALILRHYRHHRSAERILESQALYSRQRDGLFDMARRFLNVLTDEGYARMVTPQRRVRIAVREAVDQKTRKSEVVIDRTEQDPTHDLPQFEPARFVESADTLYALSMAGPDGATPLTSALVGQILEAALDAARARPDGRLAVPLLSVLDEAANCARIAELPAYYTYAGGCGIVLMTILQVLEQGEDLWGANGLKTMRAQSIEVYGGGIAATDYLEHWSAMTGPHDVADRSRSRGAQGTNRTVSWRAEPILDTALLAALPKDRALVRLPNHGPVVVRKIWWSDTEYAPLIRKSLERFRKAADQSTAPVIGSEGDPADGGERS
ncbi:TraM recognition domain-containing protein [Nocardia gipuzkoensis]|uniref:type IV secretory system conjugative DNA transfer family protein n=2 Tax=Nocardiaceae TaxID=85025 RepID=UPI001E4420C5|nr:MULTISPECIES: TraM recognition domain-containing protein [Nocardia]UGT70828.1 TraM recognition domain-containing protein [Nocardia gipuzkoensis]